MMIFKDVPTIRVSSDTSLKSIRDFVKEHPDNHVVEALQSSKYILHGMLDGVSFAFQFSNEEVPWARLSYNGVIVAEMCDNPLNKWAVSNPIPIHYKLEMVKRMVLEYCRVTIL